mmetsp:Transcript_6063/g.11061  ORF Transcript_6063/g.11061 Transcript_6063/m.11061 type:complete len:241 (+) Transcript_6063:88-810(+)
MEEDEANYDDDNDEPELETRPAEDEGAATNGDEKPQAKPKQNAKKRRRGRAKAKPQKTTPVEKEDSKISAETIGRSILTAKMKKTKMCEFHKEGRCKYGSDCAFAHDSSELQEAPDLRKTRLCRAFLQGKCTDDDCKFAHGEEELRASNICFKTALCTWFEKGNCQSGAQCRFAHGAEELRDDPDAKAAVEMARKRLAERERDEDARSKRARTAELPVCYRCGSTIATTLGYTVCALCRC